MNADANNLYHLSDEREKTLWNDCIFVFDSSALLDFYSVPKNAREKIYSDILRPHQKRFWIPSHVQFEFLKNRQSTIVKPISEQYEPLQTGNLKKIEDSLKTIEKQTSDLQNKVKTPETHPHFDAAAVDKFNASIIEFRRSFNDMTRAVNAHITQAIKEIKELPENDDVLTAFKETLKVGRDYLFEEIYKITEEGKHRFQYSMPPGYKDLENSEKKGTQIFGDLIIWKQLLEYSKGIKKPVIFICDDLKEDWCYVDKRSGNEKRISMPREELIKEMYDLAGVSFWMYNLPQFLHLANKYWDATINETDIKNVAEAIATRDQPSIVELEIVFQGGSRSPMGLSSKNQVNVKDGREIVGINPIMHWLIEWLLQVRVHNNSNYPIYNVIVESVGKAHFDQLDDLYPVNNIKPSGYIILGARFSQRLESVHTDADDILGHKIPQALEGLLLRISYDDEKGNKNLSYAKIENNKVINF